MGDVDLKESSFLGGCRRCGSRENVTKYDAAGRVSAIVVFVVRRLFCGRPGSCSSMAGRHVSVEDQHQGWYATSKSKYGHH